MGSFYIFQTYNINLLAAYCPTTKPVPHILGFCFRFSYIPIPVPIYVLVKVTLAAVTDKSTNSVGLHYWQFIPSFHKVLSGVGGTDYPQPFRLIEAQGKREENHIGDFYGPGLEVIHNYGQTNTKVVKYNLVVFLVIYS